ncbi:uncharacterized protein CcaverHIS019_0111700 [Cutaneotrichosporon cavernicola]|uniref:Antiviral helicase n=1 Tax=Cutaneotrichosporon cavernicola TaxID=279322 RepID=A0AA48I319_9TREE|nr:uncharacterized protein CcaverHIS019_0111700 [Cutaneotrichosporon cavernicola]BEI88452.1 hypothetical protein CcaverHIS019_0111700 [Cutaneotrichosporon cavernicola]BEI96225.1 hypothetical protein CcaverHIS631_0111740 [Cutaneotrichosporon cavernicola]BEJ03996.1 hypothetical protein CcaverHIS641_0111710 [Cutaneotrichosporon cavernicola]
MAGTPGPSKKQRKRGADSKPSKSKPAKQPRLDADDDPSDVDMPTGPPSRDPMRALDEAEHAGEGVHDGPVIEADGIVPGVAPVRADEFSTEAEREVAGGAGLAGDEADMKIVHSVRHQVALPPGYPYVPISDHKRFDPPAKTYPFELDPFQYVATSCIERSESVLVSAHTSAGKTVVAEFAIATCLKEGKRIVYTSPIKALSNQKFREFQEEFGEENIGLMTGDVTINPSASCLVMTTEILRSMLYRGSEVVRELAWVVFDEVHYMRDKDRGVVWEETLILLSHTVRCVFLSATIPNSMEFAEWWCQTHEQPCHIVYTDFRPTPLQHYLFPTGSEGIYLVVDEKSNFREDNFQKAMAALAANKGEDSADPNAGAGRKGNKTRKGAMKGGTSDIYKIVKLVMNKNLNPVIVFAFSKRECEAHAMQMSKIDMNTEDEAKTVEQVFENAIAVLSDDDKKLPQIEHLLPLLKRGIGIHHGGLLPIMKEVIEILFQEGLLKCLFATETFSIGLNMPAKTVVFTDVQKFDGKNFRNLSGGEYIQMSGRAGRRGLDTRGIVIMMVNEKLEPEAAKGMVKGQADRLDSAFSLGYNMVLNLMRVEGISPEYMLERSFHQFQNSLSIPALEAQLAAAEKERDAITVDREDDVEEYYELRESLKMFEGDFKAVINHPDYALPFMQPGRLVEIKDGDRDFGWCVVVAYHKLENSKRGRPVVGPNDPPQKHYVLDVLCRVEPGTEIGKPNSDTARAARPDARGDVAIIAVTLDAVQSIAHIRLKMPTDLRQRQQKEQAYKLVDEVKRRFKGAITLLDPVANQGIKDEGFRKLVRKIKVLEDRVASLPIANDPALPALFDTYDRKATLNTKVRELKKRIGSVQDVLQLEELKARKRVLRRLGFVDGEVATVKGRVACELSTGDELLLTELMFGGTFNDLAPEALTALLSCFVFDEKSEAKTQLNAEIAAPLRTLQETARRIAQVSVESKLPLVEDEYVQSFKVEMAPLVYAWCKGSPFSEIVKMTDIFEGSIIRSLRRLLELLRQLVNAANVIGNADLEAKFTKCIEITERTNSVVFNPSLYL